jgi:hypothetical protein
MQTVQGVADFDNTIAQQTHLITIRIIVARFYQSMATSIKGVIISVGRLLFGKLTSLAQQAENTQAVQANKSIIYHKVLRIKIHSLQRIVEQAKHLFLHHCLCLLSPNIVNIVKRVIS